MTGKPGDRWDIDEPATTDFERVEFWVILVLTSLPIACGVLAAFQVLS